MPDINQAQRILETPNQDHEKSKQRRVISTPYSDGEQKQKVWKKGVETCLILNEVLEKTMSELSAARATANLPFSITELTTATFLGK